MQIDERIELIDKPIAIATYEDKTIYKIGSMNDEDYGVVSTKESLTFEEIEKSEELFVNSVNGILTMTPYFNWEFTSNG